MVFSDSPRPFMAFFRTSIDDFVAFLGFSTMDYLFVWTKFLPVSALDNHSRSWRVCWAPQDRLPVDFLASTGSFKTAFITF